MQAIQALTRGGPGVSHGKEPARDEIAVSNAMSPPPLEKVLRFIAVDAHPFGWNGFAVRASQASRKATCQGPDPFPFPWGAGAVEGFYPSREGHIAESLPEGVPARDRGRRRAAAGAAAPSAPIAAHASARATEGRRSAMWEVSRSEPRERRETDVGLTFDPSERILWSNVD